MYKIIKTTNILSKQNVVDACNQHHRTTDKKITILIPLPITLKDCSIQKWLWQQFVELIRWWQRTALMMGRSSLHCCSVQELGALPAALKMLGCCIGLTEKRDEL